MPPPHSHAPPELRTLRVEVDAASGVGTLVLARPFKSNALSWEMFLEIPRAVAYLDADPAVRAVLVRGEGKHFCAGIDLATFESDVMEADARAHGGCEARLRVGLLEKIKAMQDSNTCLELCRKPVIAAIHGACWGGGIDLVTAADIRLCSDGASFCVKEVDLAITADLGTLQRLPHIVGHGAAMELSLTARVFGGGDAARMGLVSKSFPSKGALDEAAGELARQLAAKSPLALAGTKANLLHARDNPDVGTGLRHVAMWNAAMLQGSKDAEEALGAMREKRPPVFSKL